MKHRTKRFFSGLVATSLLASQIPQLIFPVSANTPTMEQAYFQVLDDIVKEYGLCTDVWSYGYGLLYAELIDFDQDGQDELFLITKTEPGTDIQYNYEYDLGYGYFPYELEVWGFEDGIARNLIGNQYEYIGDFHSSLALFRNENGHYFLLNEAGISMASWGDATYVENGESKTVKWDGGWSPETGLLSAEVNDSISVEVAPNDSISVEVDQSEYFDTKLYETMDQYFPVSNATHVFDVIHQFRFVVESDLSLYYDLQAKNYQSLEVEEILTKLPYTGDTSKIYMTAEQALAMADQMEVLPYYEYGLEGDYPVVAMFDRGDGIPNFLRERCSFQNYFGEYQYIYLNSEMWRWNGATQQVEYVPFPYESIDRDMNIARMYVQFSVDVTENGTLTTGSNQYNDFFNIFTEQYSLQDGLFHKVENYTFAFTDTSLENPEVQLSELSNQLHYDLHNIDWNHAESYALYIINGNSTASEEEYEEYRKSLLKGDMLKYADGRETAALLRAYAEKANFRYSFPDQSADSAVTDLFSNLDLSGTLLECYEVVENFYCLVMDDNGTEITYLIRCVKKNGEIIYEIVSESTQLVEETELVSQGNDYLFQSNIALDFSELSNSTTVMDYVLYFTNALHNITGIRLNDSGKSDLTLYLQDAIGNFATTSLQIQGETGEVKGEQVLPLIEKSKELTSAFIELLTAENEELNKDLEQCIRVVLQGLNEQNWTIYLNSDLMNQLGDNNLQVFLSSGQEGIEIAPEDLDLLLNKYGGLFINVQSTGADQYAISFADAEGNAIEKLEAPVKIFLPTENQFATVILESVQGTENWGGQFNSSTNTIQFSTIHGGTYLIVDNSVEIHDVDDTYKTMIQFMVSKGFFEVDDEGNFHPNGTMTRNDFTKIIVTMFFALDRDLKSSFPDVLEDSPYYAYIASGESRDIVAGYDDGLFYGDIIMTEEMAFTLISQTLVDKKGYYYPDELDFYLNSVSGAKNSSEWSMQNIALSIRDSIILPDESITPLGDISRQDAAIYLYRLFMLLEEKQQVSFELAEEIQLPSEVSSESGVSGGSPAVFLAGGAGVALIGTALYLGKKKKV